MGPSSNETPNLTPPSSIGESLPSPDQASEKSVQDPEQAPAGAEQAARRAAQAATAMPTIPLPGTTPAPTPSVPTDVTITTNVNTPNVAGDSDLIEKEWVNKAKAIVNNTRDDPYQQSEQLTEVKADYMKKRYGKSIKLSK